MICEEHPILGTRRKEPIVGNRRKGKIAKIFFEGTELPAEEGEPIAVALLAAGIKDFRVTRKRREARGIYCANGRCTDCMMIVDGQPNVRTCITPVVNGMRVERG